jgi:hypothetical protein
MYFRTLIFNTDENLHDSLQSLTRNMAQSAKATSPTHAGSWLKQTLIKDTNEPAIQANHASICVLSLDFAPVVSSRTGAFMKHPSEMSSTVIGGNGLYHDPSRRSRN